MSDAPFIPIRESSACGVDKIYLLPTPNEETCRWPNSLPREEYWKWIGEHSAVIKNLKTGEVEKK